MNASKLLYISHDIHEHQITEQDLYMVIFYKIENEKKRKIYIYIDAASILKARAHKGRDLHTWFSWTILTREGNDTTPNHF